MKVADFGRHYYRLELDYDGLTREDVDHDAKSLVEHFPELGRAYRIESSKTRDHYHVIFVKSKFETFEEPYQIALQSRADPDWLGLCKLYQCFGLETEGARRYNEIRQQREKQRVVNKPVKMLTSPIILDLLPTSPLDARRIVKVCEAIDDKEWEYTAFVHVWELKHHVQIGCRDEAQAIRRQKWLSEQGLNFVANIKKNMQV